MELPVIWTLHRSGGFVLVGRCMGPESILNCVNAQQNIKIAAIDLVCKLTFITFLTNKSLPEQNSHHVQIGNVARK